MIVTARRPDSGVEGVHDRDLNDEVRHHLCDQYGRNGMIEAQIPPGGNNHAEAIKPRDEKDKKDGDSNGFKSRNAEVDFHGQKRCNAAGLCWGGGRCW